MHILQTLDFIQKDLLPQSVIINDKTLTFRFPIQHHLDQLQSLFPDHTITQSIPTYHSKNTPHPKIKNILAIASGKGGVGKSTTTYYLAHALRHCGAKVGVLDADIYGPSQSLLFDLKEPPQSNTDKQLIPFNKHGIEVMSIGVLSGAKKALMWRGPMISQALTQLYQQTQWSELDFLLIDLPPGTGDIPLTLLQKVPCVAAILVSQPHPLAELDVSKCQHLFEHLGLPILTTVMNQSPHLCPHCHKPLQEPKTEHIAIPYKPEFASMEAFAYPEFIQLSEIITQKLTTYKVHQHNPFANINVIQTGSNDERKS